MFLLDGCPSKVCCISVTGIRPMSSKMYFSSKILCHINSRQVDTYFVLYRFEFSIAAVNEAGVGPQSPSIIIGVVPPKQNNTATPLKPPKTPFSATTVGYINPPVNPSSTDEADLGSISVLNLRVVQKSSDTIWLQWNLPVDATNLICSVNVRLVTSIISYILS